MLKLHDEVSRRLSLVSDQESSPKMDKISLGDLPDIRLHEDVRRAKFLINNSTLANRRPEPEIALDQRRQGSVDGPLVVTFDTCP